MATFTLVTGVREKIAEKTFNLGSDTLKVALTNTAHDSGFTQLSHLTEIAYTNLSSRTLTISSSTESGGVYSLTLADLTLTASGSVGPFRYVYIYDDTATNDELIGYVDYGSSLSLSNTETFVLDFSGTLLTIT